MRRLTIKLLVVWFSVFLGLAISPLTLAQQLPGITLPGPAEEAPPEPEPGQVQKPAIEEAEEGVEAEEIEEAEKADTLRVKPTAPVDRRYGIDIFSRAAGGTFISPEVPPGDEYPVGPGDQLLIYATGRVEFFIPVTVNPQGKFYVKDIGEFSVIGKTLADLKEEFRGRANRKFQESYFNISIGELRKIPVRALGNVKQPGLYEISNLSRVFHLLYACGGPNLAGTLRNIEIIRNGAVIDTLDIYDLYGGDKSGDRILEPGDIVHVGDRGNLVSVEGPVLRPAVYELREGESLQDVTKTAGGLLPKADPTRVKIIRVKKDERVVTDINMEKVDCSRLILDKGVERIIFHSIPEDLRNQASIAGNVRYPGVYEIEEVKTLDSLVVKAIPLGNTYQDVGVLIRLGEDLEPEFFHFNVKKLLAGDQSQNFQLVWQDSVHIYSKWDLAERDSITVSGEVQRPGKFAFADSLTLSHALVFAGGFTSKAKRDTIWILRVNPDKATYRDSLSQIFPVPYDSTIVAGSPKDIPLEPGDEIAVREIPAKELKRVYVAGEGVEKTGTFSLQTRDMKLSKLLKMAELREDAFLKGSYLIREKPGFNPKLLGVDVPESIKDDVIIKTPSNHVVVDFSKVFEAPEYDVTLVEGDSVIVPKAKKTVMINGGVWQSGIVQYIPQWSLNDYIEAAGGYNIYADEREGVRVIKPNGRVERVKRYWIPLVHLTLYSSYPEIEDGDIIKVAMKEPPPPWDWRGTLRDVTNAMGALTSTMILIKIADSWF